MQEKLKAFIISYTIDELVNPKTNERKGVIKSVAIVAFNKKEAGDIFIRWALAKRIYTRIYGVVCQQAKKTKRNKHFITPTTYKRQFDAIEKLEERTDA